MEIEKNSFTKSDEQMKKRSFSKKTAIKVFSGKNHKRERVNKHNDSKPQGEETW